MASTTTKTDTKPFASTTTDTAPATREHVKAVGLTIPYVYGGTATNTAQPLVLIPVNETGLVSEEHALPLTKKERDDRFKASDPAHTWFFIGNVTIAGEEFRAFGTHGSCSRKTAPEVITAALGNKLRRATKTEATAIAAQAIAEATEKLLTDLIAQNPALATVDRSALLGMLVK